MCCTRKPDAHATIQHTEWVTHMHEPRLTFQRIMLHLRKKWRNRVSHVNQWVMSRILMSHVTRMNESCHIYEAFTAQIGPCHIDKRVTPQIRMRHVTHMKAWSMSHIWTQTTVSYYLLQRVSRITHVWMSHQRMNCSCHNMNESSYTYERVMSHI